MPFETSPPDQTHCCHSRFFNKRVVNPCFYAEFLDTPGIKLGCRGIDFLIVVVGAFIGIQVANWNDERQNRVDEVYYLVRILKNIDDSISSNEIAIEFLDMKTRDTYWVVEKLTKGQLEAGEEEIFTKRFLAIENW